MGARPGRCNPNVCVCKRVGSAPYSFDLQANHRYGREAYQASDLGSVLLRIEELPCELAWSLPPDLTTSTEVPIAQALYEVPADALDHCSTQHRTDSEVAPKRPKPLRCICVCVWPALHGAAHAPGNDSEYAPSGNHP